MSRPAGSSGPLPLRRGAPGRRRSSPSIPLIGVLFGFDFSSRVLVCVIIALFPIVANTLFGLLSVDRSQHELFTLQGASRSTRLWKLQFPAALPAIFVGLRISAGLSVIGAIVGDFFFRQGDPGHRRP